MGLGLAVTVVSTQAVINTDSTPPQNTSDYPDNMNGRTALKILGTIALSAIAVAYARVTDEDISNYRKEQDRKYYENHTRWTDKNRWE